MPAGFGNENFALNSRVQKKNMVFLYLIEKKKQTLSTVGSCELHGVYAQRTKFEAIVTIKNALPTLSIYLGIPKLIF